MRRTTAAAQKPLMKLVIGNIAPKPKSMEPPFESLSEAGRVKNI